MKEIFQSTVTLIVFLMTLGIFLLPDYAIYKQKTGIVEYHTFFHVYAYLVSVLVILGYIFCVYHFAGKLFDRIKED